MSNIPRPETSAAEIVWTPEAIALRDAVREAFKDGHRLRRSGQSLSSASEEICQSILDYIAEVASNRADREDRL